MTVLMRTFTDAMEWDSQQKTAISVRDGVLEYYGHELGVEPADKMFTVYRSPATIANVRDAMVGISLTNGHVDTDEPVGEPVGSVLTAEFYSFIDETTDARIAIKNTIDVSGPMLAQLELGQRELSLGYKGELHTHTKYDYEQLNIVPHHLASVPAGRCGSACSFLDKKPDGVDPMTKTKKLTKRKAVAPARGISKKFLDAEGMPNLQEVVEIAQQIPEALKALPMDELQKVLPTLQDLIILSGAASADEVEEAIEEDEILDEEVTDEEAEELKDEEKEMADKEENFADSKAFTDAVASQVALHTEVMEKARHFVDESYSFKGKDTKRIMRDALKSEHGSQSFADAELSVAFKMLKKSNNTLQNFGDKSPDGLVARVAKMAKGE